MDPRERPEDRGRDHHERRARDGHGAVQGRFVAGGNPGAGPLRTVARQEPREVTDLNVALIGYAFMGRAHSNAYRQVTPFFAPSLTPRMKVICGRTRAKVEQAARQFGWDEAATEWQQVVGRRDIDLVDIVTPGDSHHDIAIAAA